MKRLSAAIGSALLGVLYSLALVALANALHLPKRIPLFSDDDSDLRIACFLGLELPSFALLGAWIGRSRTVRAFTTRWIAAALGSVAGFVILAALSPSLSQIASRTAANAAAVLVMLGEPFVSTVGVWLAGRLGPAAQAARAEPR